MIDAVYRIVEHDGGWAYKLGSVFSETFASRAEAEAVAERVAAEQRLAGDDEQISWEDEKGVWHDEVARGTDRPNSYVAHDPEPSPDLYAGRTSGQRVLDGVRGLYDQGDAYTRHSLRVARAQTRGQPVATLIVAGLCGYGLSWLLHRAR